MLTRFVKKALTRFFSDIVFLGHGVFGKISESPKPQENQGFLTFQEIPKNHFWERKNCFWENFIVFGSVFGKVSEWKYYQER